MIVEAAVPHEIPGWDDLAANRTCYLSADWLRFVDTDGVGRSRYLGHAAGDRLVAALCTHASPDADVLTLGGRRGFLSSVLVAPGSSGQHAELLRHATDGASWWWPYLPAPDVDLVLAAGGRLGIRLIGADCVIDLVGSGVDDHVAALPTRQRRTNFRREQRRFADSKLEIRRVALCDYWPRLGVLLAAVQHKYGHQQSAEDLGVRLRLQGEHLGERAVVFACFAGDTVIGFALALRGGDELALRAVGFDYERLTAADEYAQLAVHAPLHYCYENGLRRLHLGTDSDEAKCRRGARSRPLWAVTSLPGPEPGDTEQTAHRIAASLPAHESESFTRQVDESMRRWAV
jgi:hypothetical protein